MIGLLSNRSGLLAVAAVLCVGSIAPASAQTNSLFGNRGPASQIGSNANGAFVGQMGSLGSGLTGQSAIGTQPGNSAGGLVGRNDNTNRFVGNERAGQQPGQNNSSRDFGNTGNRNRNRGAGGTGTPFGAGQFAGRGQSQRARRIIRPRHEVAFSFPQRNLAAISTSLSSRFIKIGARQNGLQGLNVTVDQQGTAVLQGEVDSSKSKKLAAILARLEPGVRAVRNELTVRQTADAE